MKIKRWHMHEKENFRNQEHSKLFSNDNVYDDMSGITVCNREELN